jgi:adenylate kinase
MDRGELVPDQLIIDLVREVLAGLDGGTSVIFDGFPRTVPQAEALEGALAEVGRKVDGVVALEADDEVLVKRMAGRRSCPTCGAVYNVHFNPPARPGKCDKDGTDLVHRVDDDPTTVRYRLDVYRRDTAPLVRFYQESAARMRIVEADRPVEEVQRGLREAVA